MMEDIRKILEAVASGDITPEEGEMLIRALKEREGNDARKEKEKYEDDIKEVLIDEDEIVEDDYVLSGKKVNVEGTINGDLVLMMCKTMFSGYVKGDMVVIGGSIEFRGGKVDGDLALIGVKHTGKEPEVKGDFVKITNFLATSILTAISPIIRGINIKSKKKRRINS